MKTPTKPIFQLKKRNPRIWAIAFGCYTRPHLKIRVENCERSDNISNNNKKLPERLCKITNNIDLWSQYLVATPDHTSKSGSAIVSEASTADPDFEVWSGVASKYCDHKSVLFVILHNRSGSFFVIVIYAIALLTIFNPDF